MAWLLQPGTSRSNSTGLSRCSGAKPLGRQSLLVLTVNGTNCRRALTRGKQTPSWRDCELSRPETLEGWRKASEAQEKKQRLSVVQYEESALNATASNAIPDDLCPPRSMRMFKAHNLAAGEHGETVSCPKAFRAPVYQLGFSPAVRVSFASELDSALGRVAQPAPPLRRQTGRALSRQRVDRRHVEPRTASTFG
jgi:hypothetical protein